MRPGLQMICEEDFGENGTCACMLHRYAFAFQFPLEFTFALPQIVPEAGEVGPLAGGFAVGSCGKHVSGEFGGEVGDFVEVAVLRFEIFAMEAGTGVFSGAGDGGVAGVECPEGGEEGFPLFLRRELAVGFCFGVGVEIGHTSNHEEDIIFSFVYC